MTSTAYFQSKDIVKKTVKMPPPMALGGISLEWFKQGSHNFPHLLGTVSVTNLPDMMSLAASG